MKKLSYLIVLALILGLVLTGCSLLSNVGQVPTTERKINVGGEFPVGTLVAGKNINVGIVSVWNDDEKLCVEYQLSDDAIDDGWFLTETHWAWAIESVDIPQKNGNPIPGQFLYGDDSLSGEISSYQECISPSELPLGTPIYIAAHAVVKRIIGYTEDESELPIFQTESAWADGFEFTGKNWATYFDYCYGVGVLDAKGSGATFADNGDGTGTLTITLKDFCGNPMEYAQRYFRANPESISNENYYYIGGSIISYATKASSQGYGVYTFTVTKPCGWNDLWDICIAYGTTTDRIVIKEGLNIEIAFTPFLEGEWEIDFLISGGTWEHSMFIIDHETDGTLEGNGGYPRDAVFSHEWDLDGEVTCVTDKSSEPWTDVIGVDITIVYTTANAGYTLYLDGTVDFENKTMSGNMTGSSSGTWTATKR